VAELMRDVGWVGDWLFGWVGVGTGVPFGWWLAWGSGCRGVRVYVASLCRWHDGRLPMWGAVRPASAGCGSGVVVC